MSKRRVTLIVYTATVILITLVNAFVLHDSIRYVALFTLAATIFMALMFIDPRHMVLWVGIFGFGVFFARLGEDFPFLSAFVWSVMGGASITIVVWITMRLFRIKPRQSER